MDSLKLPFLNGCPHSLGKPVLVMDDEYNEYDDDDDDDDDEDDKFMYI